MGKSILLHLSYLKSMVIVLMLFATVLDAVVDEICSVSRCSYEGPDIHFPFWLKRNNSGDQPEDDCSHPPGFQLSCGTLYGEFENPTILELQQLVNSSTNGFQLSFMYTASIISIDYKHHRIRVHRPYLTDVIPTAVLANSSKHIPLNNSRIYTPDYSYGFNYPYIPFNDLPLTCENSYDSCQNNDFIEEYSFFNCSSSQTVVEDYGTRPFSSLSTRDFKVYAFPSVDDTFYMMEYIKSCTKMYDTSSKLHPLTLSWQTPVSRVRCEDVRERCKFDDIHRTPRGSISNPAYFEPPPAGSGFATTKRLIAVILPCIFLVGLASIFLYIFIQSRVDKQKKEDELKIKMFMEDYKALKPTRYSYTDIKKITNMFKQKLGQGGYGTVFMGQISSDILVAVKVLHSDSKANGDDFINEVGTIGKIHHVNVVRLLGYCADGCNRALVYEFQPNHSLEKFVYRREKPHSFIGWKKMQKIALGIAKGIKYLHQGCAQQILHFDIKPNNILLDRNFNPKISDFGLAKLCNKGQSIVSMTAARGTIGYIAPEVFSRNFGNVSTKSDVYSFGMLLLEMVGGKNNDVEGKQNTSDVYFPEWIFHRLEKGGELVIQIENENDSKIARKLTIVGLWCIGWHPIDRPSMKLVIQMLEADECPAMPPNPFSSATSGNAAHAKSIFSEKLQVISEAE